MYFFRFGGLTGIRPPITLLLRRYESQATLTDLRRHPKSITKMTKNTRITSPAGVAQYAYLKTPDTKWNDEGVYTITLRLSKDGEGTKLKNNLETLLQMQVKEVTATNGKKPKILPLPIKETVTDDGVESYDFKFKMKPSFKSKTGERIEQRPKVFDSALAPMQESVGRGSTIKVNFMPAAYSTSLGTGVTLRLYAVQVLDLVPVGGGVDAFSVEEGGFTTSASTNGSVGATTDSTPQEEDALSAASF